MAVIWVLNMGGTVVERLCVCVCICIYICFVLTPIWKGILAKALLGCIQGVLTIAHMNMLCDG